MEIFSWTLKELVLMKHAEFVIFVLQMVVSLVKELKLKERNMIFKKKLLNLTFSFLVFVFQSCVYPGNYYETHSAAWVEGAYYEYPPNVWWAIIFVFVVLILGVQVTHLVFVIKSTL